MEQNKSLVERIVNAKWYKHFIVIFISTFIVFFAMLYNFGMDGKHMTLNKVFQCCTLVGLLIACIFTWFINMMKISASFFEYMRGLKADVEKATTVDELKNLAVLLIQYHKKYSFHSETNRASKEVYDLIQTRLKYEFKAI